MNYIKIISLNILLAFTFSVKSQTDGMHEISVHAGTGLHQLKYEAASANSKPALGGILGVDYGYFFNDYWSIQTGLEIGYYQSKIKLNDFRDRYQSFDGEYDFEFRSHFFTYEEKQKAMLLNIPVMAHFETQGDLQFYVAFGGKIGIPIFNKAHTAPFTVKTSGYYEQWDALIEMPQFKGFGTFERESEKYKMKLNPVFMLSLESGFKWELFSMYQVYTGIYLDYSLNSLVKQSSNKILTYHHEHPTAFTQHSILTSDHVKKVVPFSVGIKIRFLLNDLL